MRSRIAGVLLVYFFTLMLGCSEKIWLPKSYAKAQNLRKEVYEQIRILAERDNYFSSHSIMPYVNKVMNSLNDNNGQAIIIARDGLRYAKITCILDSDENIDKLTVQQLSKDFGELFKQNQIDQTYWIQIIDRFNEGGHEISYENSYANVTVYDNIVFVYDFKGDRLLIKHDRREGRGENSYRMMRIRTR
jgi:hypothetical protein